MSVKFIHRRYITAPTKQDKEAGRSFSVSGKGGVTVAYQWDKGAQRIVVAVARCSYKDNFDKRVARDIALGRLQSTKKNRNEKIDLLDVSSLTPLKVEDIVYDWLENQERLWDAEIVSHTVH